MNAKIDRFKKNAMKLKLGQKAMEKVIRGIRERDVKQSAIILFIESMIDKHEALWPKGESRIPFFV